MSANILHAELAVYRAAMVLVRTGTYSEFALNMVSEAIQRAQKVDEERSGGMREHLASGAAAVREIRGRCNVVLPGVRSTAWRPDLLSFAELAAITVAFDLYELQLAHTPHSIHQQHVRPAESQPA